MHAYELTFLSAVEDSDSDDYDPYHENGSEPAEEETDWSSAEEDEAEWYQYYDLRDNVQYQDMDDEKEAEEEEEENEASEELEISDVEVISVEKGNKEDDYEGRRIHQEKRSKRFCVKEMNGITGVDFFCEQSVEAWSAAQIKSWVMRLQNAESFYYRFTGICLVCDRK